MIRIPCRPEDCRRVPPIPGSRRQQGIPESPQLLMVRREGDIRGQFGCKFTVFLKKWSGRGNQEGVLKRPRIAANNHLFRAYYLGLSKRRQAKGIIEVWPKGSLSPALEKSRGQ